MTPARWGGRKWRFWDCSICLLCSGSTILVPILIRDLFFGKGASYGLSIQVTLLFAGLGTLFFHLCSKFQIPAFLGSSFAFLGGFQTIATLDTGIFAGMPMSERLPYACGGIVVAGLMYLVLAAIIKTVGVHRVMRFLPPVVTGPDYHLYRPDAGAVRRFQRIQQLVFGDCGAGRNHHFQYLGQGNV